MVEGGRTPGSPELDRLRHELRRNPAARVFLELAACLLAAGRHAEVVEVCKKGLEHHPQEPSAFVTLGRALHALGRLADAQAALVRAVKLDPADPDSLRWLGEVVLAKGERKRARELFAHALKRSPGNLVLRELFESTEGETALKSSTLAGLGRPSSPAPPPVPVDAMELTETHPAPVFQPRPAGGPPQPPVPPRQEDSGLQPTGVRPMPEALRVALQAELELAAAKPTTTPPSREGPGPASGRPASAAPARGPVTPSRTRLPTPPPPKALAPPSPPRSPEPPNPTWPSEVEEPRTAALVNDRPITEELSQRDLVAATIPPTASAIEAVPRTGPRAPKAVRLARPWVRTALIVTIGLGIGAGGGFGVFQWRRLRHAEAVSILREASRELARADAAGLRRAEELLEGAIRHGADEPAIRARLELTRALSALELGAKRLPRPRLHGSATRLSDAIVARAARRLAAGDAPGARRALGARGPDRASEAIAAYLEALAIERMPHGAASDHLSPIVARFPELVPARVQLGLELLLARKPAQARVEAESARQHEPTSARPALVSVLADAVTIDAAAVLALADKLDHSVQGSPCDRLLLAAARAAALRRLGQRTDAVSAVRSVPIELCYSPRQIALYAREAFESGARDLGLSSIERARRFDAEGTALRLEHARMLIGRRQVVPAQALLAPLGSSAEAQLLRAWAAMADKRSGRARQIVDAARARWPDHLELELLELRLRIAGSERDAAAEQRIAALETVRPDDPAVCLAAGEAALVARDGAASARLLGRSIAAGPTAEAYFRLGQAQRLIGSFGQAVASFRGAHALDPDFVEALEAAASLEAGRGRSDDAIALYERLGSLPGQAAQASVALAELHLERGQIEAARRKLDATSEASVSDEPALYRRYRLVRARLLGALGERDRAIGLLEPLLAPPARDAEAFVVRAELRRDDRGSPESAADFDAALSIDTSLPEALIGRLELALEQGDRRRAEELALRAGRAVDGRLRPPSVHVRLLCGRARLELLDGQDGQAINLLSMGRDMAPHFPDTFYWLGKALGVRAADGAAAYRHYLELAPAGRYARAARRAIR